MPVECGPLRPASASRPASENAYAYPILIIGAGLAGLTLARILDRHGIAFVICEAENGPGVRPQGGLLDMEAGTGQEALRMAGLWPDFTAQARPCEDAKRIVTKAARLLFERAPDAVSRPEIARGDLRHLLLASVPAGQILWGQKLIAVTRDGALGWRAQLASGRTISAGLVVGADGAWSRLRPHLTDVTPDYTGTSLIGIDLAEPAPELLALTGRGTLMALAPGKGILLHCNGDDSLSGYIALTARQELLEAQAVASETGRTWLLRAFDGWDRRLLALIARGRLTGTLRPIHALPVGHRWRHVPGLTLIGDAAHLMSPFSGMGANLALWDGARLGTLIAACAPDHGAAAIRHEAEMFDRTEPVARASAGNLSDFFGQDAPSKAAGIFRRSASR